MSTLNIITGPAEDRTPSDAQNQLHCELGRYVIAYAKLETWVRSKTFFRGYEYPLKELAKQLQKKHSSSFFEKSHTESEKNAFLELKDELAQIINDRHNLIHCSPERLSDDGVLHYYNLDRDTFDLHRAQINPDQLSNKTDQIYKLISRITQTP